MSKRRQAPGELEHVRAFVNTVDIEQRAEQLQRPSELAEWLVARELAPSELEATSTDLERALEFREALRAVLVAHTERTPPPADACLTLDEVAHRACVQLRFDQRGEAMLVPASDGVDGALGRVLAIVQGAIERGSWERLKACREHTCEWAFYDHTKNHSGAWCTMDVCGNRAKARAYRERQETAHQSGRD